VKNTCYRMKQKIGGADGFRFGLGMCRCARRQGFPAPPLVFLVFLFSMQFLVHWFLFFGLLKVTGPAFLGGAPGFGIRSFPLRSGPQHHLNAILRFSGLVLEGQSPLHGPTDRCFKRISRTGLRWRVRPSIAGVIGPTVPRDHGGGENRGGPRRGVVARCAIPNVPEPPVLYGRSFEVTHLGGRLIFDPPVNRLEFGPFPSSPRVDKMKHGFGRRHKGKAAFGVPICVWDGTGHSDLNETFNTSVGRLRLVMWVRKGVNPMSRALVPGAGFSRLDTPAPSECK